MSQEKTVAIGFEVGTGDRVDVPLGHMVVCGQTQRSGKTTLLEAAAARSGRKVLAFRTKRGEGAFGKGVRLPAYVQERADWQFVESILESTMRSRMKFERAWIMRACRGAKTLADVDRNVAKLQRDAKRGMDRDMYMMLGEYLAIVVPILAQLPKAPARTIGVVVNVVDLIGLPEEVQGLVIASWLTRVHEDEEGVICLIPEAWKYLPQGRNSPVKMGATRIAREGAALGNLLWMDAQDLAGFEKEHQRGASVFCLGVQREMNEVKRNLDLLPADVKKPKPADVVGLELGQFLVCQPGRTQKTYVWPVWMDGDVAQRIAQGKEPVPARRFEALAEAEKIVSRALVKEVHAEVARSARAVEALTSDEPFEIVGSNIEEEEDEMPGVVEAVEKMQETLNAVISRLDRALGPKDVPRVHRDEDPPPTPRASKGDIAQALGLDEDGLYQRVLARLLKDPKVIKVLATESRIEVSTEVTIIEVDGKTLPGRLALLVKEGFFDEGKTGNQAWLEVRHRGYPSKSNGAPGELYKTLSTYAADGFLTVDGKTYSTVDGAAKRIRDKGAK